MQVRRYDSATPFSFAEFTLRELSPEAFDLGTVAEVLVPIGADRPVRVSEKRHRMYVVVSGDIEFRVNGEILRLSAGDVVHVAAGEEYGFHNGGYEEGRLLLIRVPGPSEPEA